MVDYFLIKRGNIHTPSLFNPTAGTLYYYSKGWNLKALACWVCAVLFGIPGLVGAYHPTWVSEAALNMNKMGWVLCFAVAAGFYFVVVSVLPAQVTPGGYQADPKDFESFAVTDGYLEGDALIEFGIDTIQNVEDPESGRRSTTSNEIVEKIDEKH